MITAYYKNSRGDILNLLEYPFCAADAEFFNSDWTESTSGYERTVQVDVWGTDDNDFAKNMEHLYSVISVDAEEATYGRLYVNDTSLRCRVRESKKTNWKGYVFSEVELTFTAPELAWVREEKNTFFPQEESTAADGLDFTFDFPFDFADPRRGSAAWEIDHVTASDFQMIVYGPCVNPKVLINDNAYEVFTTLEANEYMIIDSRDYTAYKYLTNGTEQSLFDNRGLEQSIFEKIPSGMLRINWSGDFGFDLTLFLERREAQW